MSTVVRRLRKGLPLAVLAGLLALAATGTPGSASASASLAGPPAQLAAGSAAGLAVAPAAGICAAPALAGSMVVGTRGSVVVGYDAEQVARARRILDEGVRQKAPARAQALALTAALAESGLERGSGPALTGAFHGPGASPSMASVGVRAFYARLLAVPDWSTLPPEVAVHRVTRNADPLRYDPFWAPALTLVDKLARGSLDVPAIVQSGARSPRWCRPRSTTDLSGPLPPGTGYRVTSARAKPARRAAAPVEVRGHCGTAVLAASAGTVKVGEPTATGWPLEIANASARVVARYTGLVALTVSDGQSIGAGQQVGELGSLGSTDRCSLGFRVLGGTGQDLTPMDTTAWLDTKVQAPPGRGAPSRPAPVVPPRPTTTRVATFNVLGAHHSAAGGKNAGMADGAVRMRQALAMLESRGVDIAAFQEFEGPQAAVVSGDGDWSLLRGTGNSRLRGGDFSGNAIAWRTDEWRLVSSEEVRVAWDVTLHMPVAHLEHVDTGADIVVMGVHNPASTSKKGDQQGARDRARAIERSAVAQLRSRTGNPVFVLGDMNERTTVFCDFTRDGLMTTPWGSAGPGCSTPRGINGGVDWIFGAGSLTFGAGVVDRSPKGSISDHPLVMADVTVGG